MKATLKDTVLRGLAGIMAIALVTGCATTARNIDSTEELARATNGDQIPVVFGKLRLVRNGEEIAFGEGLTANSATLNLFEAGARRQFVGKVGNAGEFSWALPAGTYQVESVAFRFQGQTIEPETNFTFTVSPEHDASYLGTITLEASFDAGYMGVHGVVDRFTVSDQCDTDCGQRLSQLGISDTASTTSLFRWEGPRD